MRSLLGEAAGWLARGWLAGWQFWLLAGSAAACSGAALPPPAHLMPLCPNPNPPSAAACRKIKYLYDGDCSMCLSLVSMLRRQDDGQVGVGGGAGVRVGVSAGRDWHQHAHRQHPPGPKRPPLNQLQGCINVVDAVL